MGKKRGGAFVRPGVMKLPLWGAKLTDPACEWVEVKTALSYRERQDHASAIFKSMDMPADPQALSEMDRKKVAEIIRLNVDLGLEGPARILTWVTDWNLTDADGKHVDFCARAVDMLDPEYADEIVRVLEEEGKRQQREKAESSGEAEPNETSSSASGSDGLTVT